MQKIFTSILNEIGLSPTDKFREQLSRAELVEEAIVQGEGKLSDSGALNILTGKFTGRSPKDRFFVKDHLTIGAIDWNDVNQPMSTEVFNILRDRVVAYFANLETIHYHEAQVGSFTKYALNCAFLTEKAFQNLFVSNMFIAGTASESDENWIVLVASELFIEDYAELGLNGQNCVAIDFSQKSILVIGTGYTGEIKKSLFTVMNFLLPHSHGVLPMHCAANTDAKGDTALFFGLSGTGKTTLSTDKGRYLIGDDEHAWSDEGIFNLEGGCYAKCVGLKEESEPDIFHAARFGALTENVVFQKGKRVPDYADTSITENIRVSYPLSYISGSVDKAISKAPKSIFFLTADAFGILPPISKLSIEQAMFYFVNGYTAKVAGTEMGISHPVATFSACFGKAFMPLHPMQYANMLRQRLEENPINVWLVNTGWIGGPYGVGRRISLQYTRTLLRAALRDELTDVFFRTDSIFGLSIPQSCPDVPDEILNPRSLWDNKEAYDVKAAELKALFADNYKKYAEKHQPIAV